MSDTQKIRTVQDDLEDARLEAAMERARADALAELLSASVRKGAETKALLLAKQAELGKANHERRETEVFSSTMMHRIRSARAFFEVRHWREKPSHKKRPDMNNCPACYQLVMMRREAGEGL